jgi:hypothetical protein
MLGLVLRRIRDHDTDLVFDIDYFVCRYSAFPGDSFLLRDDSAANKAIMSMMQKLELSKNGMGSTRCICLVREVMWVFSPVVTGGSHGNGRTRKRN